MDHLVSEVYPRSAEFIDGILRRQTLVAERTTNCLRKGVACCVFHASTRAFIVPQFNGTYGRLCTGVKGGCGCTHAEIVAIRHLKSKRSLQRWAPFIFVVSYSCCLPCAKAMVASGFVEAFAYRVEAKHHPRGLPYLRDNGIQVLKLPEIEGDIDK